MAEQVPADPRADDIGRLADKCDNLLAAADLPLPAQTHLAGMRGGLIDVRDELRAIYVELTGDNPWKS